MQVNNVYKLWGADGSPYSCKMRAILRYRHIPFVWVATCDHGGFTGGIFDKFKGIPPVIPVLEYPDGSYTNDSTPMILELEKKFSERSIVPADQTLSLLSALVEDFADEWLTKVMFEGRFHTKQDAIFGASWQAFQSAEACKSPIINHAAEGFADRQIGRRQIVGSTDWDSMETTLRSVCEIIKSNIRNGIPFLFGHLPSNADFGLFGQLRQLAADPLPSRIVQEYPEVWGWVWRMDDLSGYGTISSEIEKKFYMTPAAKAMLKLIGETYAPFAVANKKALQNGEKNVTVSIFGSVEHTQPAFKYQSKCLDVLRKQYNQISDKSTVDPILNESGLRAFFSENSKL